MIDLFFIVSRKPTTASQWRLNIYPANAEDLREVCNAPDIDYTIGSLDEPNSVFPTHEDAATYYMGVWSDNMVDQCNTFLGSSVYQNGGLLPFQLPEYLEFEGKQPLSGTLTELSDVDVSDHIKDMMETATKADARLHLELDTMALQDEADYYTKTAVDAIAAGKASASHTHVINDISNASTIGKTILGASGAGAVRSAIISIGTHINDAPVDAPTNAETNAPTDAPTNLNTVTTLLGALTGEVNSTNARQNSIAAKVNANATKQNSIATKVNDGFTKLNAVFDALETNALLAA